MEKILGGNVTHITGTSVKYQIDRFKQWYGKDPVRAINDLKLQNLVEDKKSSERGNNSNSETCNIIKSNITNATNVAPDVMASTYNSPINFPLNFTFRELFRHIINVFAINATCIQFLGYLHEKIATIALNDINGHKNLTLIKTNDTHPANYTKSMCELKNMRFDGFDHTKLQGFCPCEPIVRINQLLNFPLHIITGNDIKKLSPNFDSFPNPPNISDEKVELKSRKDVYNFITSNENALIEWEKYYIELCKIISNNI